MTDNDIYEAYKNYTIEEIYWRNTNFGHVQLKFPAAAYAEYRAIQLKETMIVEFAINENNVIILYKWLPEFVLKDVVDKIRTMRDDNNQYLWGV